MQPQARLGMPVRHSITSPIRTVTVGPGFSPESTAGRLAARGSRAASNRLEETVAHHRRWGLSPRPEMMRDAIALIIATTGRVIQSVCHFCGATFDLIGSGAYDEGLSDTPEAIDGRPRTTPTPMRRCYGRDFAGEGYQAAVVPPKARALLAHSDQRSAHYPIGGRVEWGLGGRSAFRRLAWLGIQAPACAASAEIDHPLADVGHPVGVAFQVVARPQQVRAALNG